jgi:hypothetical protein
MKIASSILFIAVLLLADYHANGQSADTSCSERYDLAFDYAQDGAHGDLNGNDWTFAYNNTKDISNNYFYGDYTVPHLIHLTPHDDDLISYFCYTYPSPSDFNVLSTLLTTAPSPTTVTCGSPVIDRASKKGSKSLGVQDENNSCESKIDLCAAWVHEDNNFDEAFDTLEKYLVVCPDSTFALSGLNDLGECIGVATQTKTPAGLLDLRNYLMSIRNISNLSGWYCTCVGYIGSTFNDIPSGLAVLKFLESDPVCSGYDSLYASQYSLGRSEQIMSWMDTAKNDSIQYFDTTLPTIDMLGLDSLLDDEATNGVQPNAPSIISFISASPNPVDNNGTIITFGMNQEAYVKFQLYDVLGKMVTVSNFGGELSPGTHEVPISLAGVASGTYYACIMTAYGEVQSIKLVKE